MGVWGSIGELGAHYMCEVRFGSVLRFQLGVQKVPLLPEMKIYYKAAASAHNFEREGEQPPLIPHTNLRRLRAQGKKTEATAHNGESL